MSLETARRVLKIEAQAIQDVLARLDERFVRAVEMLFGCKGRVVVSGMGKSGLIGRKISATFSSTGTPSFFLHPAEALHGDLGMLARGDAMLAVSYGGETEEIVRLLPSAEAFGDGAGDADGENGFDAGAGQRRGAGRECGGRGVFAEPGADGEHDCGDGSGRCAGGGAAGTAGFRPR